MSRLDRPVLMITLLVLAGCDAGDSALAVTRTDSAGVEVVTAGAVDATLDWTAADRFTLGGEPEGMESFYTLGRGSVGADEHGRLYVLDYDAHRVAVFGPGGEPIRTQGQQGGGPGEVERPSTLSVTADGTASVFDYGKSALVRWDSAGQVLSELRFPHPPMALGPHHALLEDGFLVATGGLDEEGRRAHRLLRVTGRDTTVLASIPQPSAQSVARFPSCGGGINFPPLFTPEVVWHQRDGVVAVAAEDRYRVDLYRDGRLHRSVRRDVPVTAATRELAIAEAGEGFRVDFGRGPCLVPPGEYADARGWAETVPAIASVALAPDGGLWVQRRVPGQESPPIDLFAADGAYRGTLPEGTPFPALLLPGGRIGVITTDELDVDRLVVREIGEGGTRQ